MIDSQKNPRILIVTPEVTYLPAGMGTGINGCSAKAGGLADVSASLISALFEQGADVHVALPHYRTLFGSPVAPFIMNALKKIKQRIPEERIHLAEDRAFFYLHNVYSGYGGENAKLSMAFQREVINNIVPQVRPDLIHCNDWMTGLIPAMARHLNLPCLFTIHNIYTVKTSMAHIEERGIDAAIFWQQLFFEHVPISYERARESDPVDFLASGIFASHFVNTVSPTFLNEMIEGRHPFVEPYLRQELANKVKAGCAVGILNSPDPSFNPAQDEALAFRYGPDDHVGGKRKNKRFLQEYLGLIPDIEAPLFFWPSRLDNVQKGCRLFADIMYSVLLRFWDKRLQIVFVADGEFQAHFKNIVRDHSLSDRVAIRDFDEQLARLAYSAADFVLMPSLFEPCGLPQMIGPIYGALPVVHDTGGIHDTVEPLDVTKDKGNGFVFETHDASGLFRAMDQAMRFFGESVELKAQQTQRIMLRSAEDFNHAITARHYMDLYEKMLKRPLINSPPM